MTRPRSFPRDVDYTDDDFSERRGTVYSPSDYNGSLVYVEDDETREGKWIDRRDVR